MTKQELRSKAEEIVYELNSYAREYDHYEYGLPIWGQTEEDMIEIVIGIIKRK